jgi:hypothetical protein
MSSQLLVLSLGMWYLGVAVSRVPKNWKTVEPGTLSRM